MARFGSEVTQSELANESRSGVEIQRDEAQIAFHFNCALNVTPLFFFLYFPPFFNKKQMVKARNTRTSCYSLLGWSLYRVNRGAILPYLWGRPHPVWACELPTVQILTVPLRKRAS